MSAPTLWEHVLAVLTGLVLPVTGAWQHVRARSEAPPEPLETAEKVALYWSNAAVLGLVTGAVLWAWGGAGRSFGELGLTAPPEHLGFGLALGAVLLALFALDARYKLATPARRADTVARWRRDTPFLPTTRRELFHSAGLLVVASVGEEIVYRGFLVSYLLHYTGASALGLAAAVGLPAVVFAASHLYQGFGGAARIALGAVIFGALFVVTGSLWIPIALHFAVDLVGLLLGPALLGPSTSEAHAPPPE